MAETFLRTADQSDEIDRRPIDSFERVIAGEKFLYAGGERFFVKGATYGAFAPNEAGEQFPDLTTVRKDFSLMGAAGINSILTYTVPPTWLLDEAQAHGLRIIVNVPWNSHVAYLDSARMRKQIREEVRASIRACQAHPAVLMHCVAKEMYPPVVRWHGKKPTESFLRELYDVAKQEEPEALVTYTNYPTTEYLDLDFFDVFTFNVYLHNRPDFCKYLARLQHMAREVPFVMTEFGICSHRHGTAGQAEFLDWQIEEMVDHGLAGAVWFGWTDPFYQNGMVVEEWGFGLVDANRVPKPSYHALQKRFAGPDLFSPDREWPKISVVVALHNAAGTLEDCLSSLEVLEYPDYEVIVVNDGSTDGSQEIIDRYPFVSITREQGGVSAARNEGLRAATGEIVAYIDSDARADQHWLRYLACTYLESDVVAVGGPNPVPSDDGWLAKCVYRSPGGPTEVMLDDQAAEHIPGCNMSFYKWTLEEIGGFDERFRTAADDVDICWRVLDAGHRMGFNPSAIVWHHRRPSIRAYWKQQKWYGISEALLERKYPEKFNPWGHTAWHGQIYAPYPQFRLLGRPTVYYGMWGSAGFQSLYSRGGSGALSFLPRAMEFHAAILTLSVLGVFMPWLFVVVGACVLYILGYSVTCAASARIDGLLETDRPLNRWERYRARAAIAILHMIEPLARDWGRLRGGLTPWRAPGTYDAMGASRGSVQLQPWHGRHTWQFEGPVRGDKDSFLSALMKNLSGLGCAVGWNLDWQEWDLRVRRGALGEARVQAVMEYPSDVSEERSVRLTGTIRQPTAVTWVQVALLALSAVMGFTGFVLGAVAAAALAGILFLAAVVQVNRLDRAICSAATRTAHEMSREVQTMGAL